MRGNTSYLTAAMIVCVILFCCTKKSDRNLVRGGAAMADCIHFEYAIYMLPGPQVDPMEVLHRFLRERYSEFVLVDSMPKDPRRMLLHAYILTNVQQRYAPPDLNLLRYSGNGLSEQQKQALQRSERVLIIDFAHPKQQVWLALRRADALMAQIAHDTGGLIWDEQTREVFSPDAWKDTRVSRWTTEIPDVSHETVIHVYSTGEYVRAITLGMSKLGLPDVVVEEAPWSSQNQIGNLINGFCQSVAERPILPNSSRYNLDLRKIQNTAVREREIKSLKSNGAGIGCLTLVQGTWQEGDPKNRLLELASDAYPGNDHHESQEKMLSSLFGWEDTIKFVHNDDEVLVVSAKARAKLPELHTAFNNGLRPGEFIQVKAPFQTQNGNEWMWVEISSWKDDVISGTLQNEPFEATYLHSGQVVSVREEDVFDYIRQYPDKHSEGNTTGDIIRKMQQVQSQSLSNSPSVAVPRCIEN